MARRTPESDLGGHGSKLQKEAEKTQRRGDFRAWASQYEGKPPPTETSPEIPQVNPKAYYRAPGGELLKGAELAPGPLPINLQEINPPWLERIKKELILIISNRRKPPDRARSL